MSLRNLRDAARLDRGGILIVDEHLAARGALDERDQLQNAALARARMAGQERQLALVDLERHAGQGLAAVGVALVDLIEANHRAPAPSGPDFSSADTNSAALNTPKSSVSSPTPTKRMGIFSFCAMASTTPPLAVPSSLVTTRPVTPSPLLNSLGLRDRVLADGAVEHQQHLVRRAGIEPRQHALDLLELVHQMSLGVQPPRGVGDQDVDVARARGLQAIEDDGGGLGARLLGDDGHPIALGPDLQLFARRGAKGIAGGEHDAAALGEQPVRQFADGGGLAGAVDADHQDHVGLDVGIDRPAAVPRASRCRAWPSLKAPSNASTSSSSLRATRRRSSSRMRVVASMPTSAVIRRVSRSSRISASILRPGQQFLDVGGEPGRARRSTWRAGA